jgi:hypothetical protein
MKPIKTLRGPDLEVSVFARGSAANSAELAVLASVVLRCSVLNLVSLVSVVTHALYTLDFQLALHEFGNVGKKKA